MPDANNTVDLAVVVKELIKEVERLKAELKEERKQRVFAVASANQRLLKLEQHAGLVVGDPEEDATTATAAAAPQQQQPPPQPPQEQPQPQPQPQQPAPKGKTVTISDEPPQHYAVGDPPTAAQPRQEPQAPALPAKGNGVRAPAQPSRDGVLREGTEVLVRCRRSKEDQNPSWDPAKVVSSEGGKYTVAFPDGETWSSLTSDDIRLANAPVPQQAGFAGWVWTHTSGWVQSGRTKTWMRLTGNTLSFASSPSALVPEKELPLAGAKLYTSKAEGAAKQTAFSVKGSNGVSERIECDGAFEYDAWTMHIQVSMIKAAQASGSGKIDSDLQSFYTKKVRAVVPHRASEEKKVEDEFPTLWRRYMISQYSSSWFSAGDWARRYFTIHEGFICIRPDKTLATNTVIIPLTSTTLKHTSDDAQNPYNVVVSGPFIDTPIVICPDTSEMFVELCNVLTSSYVMANPDKTPTLP